MGPGSDWPAGATLDLAALWDIEIKWGGGDRIQNLITRNYPSNVIPGAQIRRKSGAGV